MSNPYDDLKASNDAYHAAVDDVFKCEEVPVKEKAKLGASVHEIFTAMEVVDKIVKKYFEGV